MAGGMLGVCYMRPAPIYQGFLLPWCREGVALKFLKPPWHGSILEELIPDPLDQTLQKMAQEQSMWQEPQ